MAIYALALSLHDELLVVPDSILAQHRLSGRINHCQGRCTLGVPSSSIHLNSIDGSRIQHVYAATYCVYKSCTCGVQSWLDPDGSGEFGNWKPIPVSLRPGCTWINLTGSNIQSLSTCYMHVAPRCSRERLPKKKTRSELKECDLDITCQRPPTPF